MRVDDLRVRNKDQVMRSSLSRPVFPRRPGACFDVFFICQSLAIADGVYPGKDEEGYCKQGEVASESRLSSQRAE
jgi:hypothetical protein